VKTVGCITPPLPPGSFGGATPSAFPCSDAGQRWDRKRIGLILVTVAIAYYRLSTWLSTIWRKHIVGSGCNLQAWLLKYLLPR